MTAKDAGKKEPKGEKKPKQDGGKIRGEPEFEEETDNYRLAGFTSQDRMKGFLLVERKQDGLDLAPAETLKKISEGGITFGVDEAAVQDCLLRAAESKKSQLVEVARGQGAEDGTDGRVEFYVQPSSEEARYEKDQQGRINYYELNLIENVQVDQQVCRVLPPKPGVAGSDVLGDVLPARSGEAVRLRAGKGIRIGEDGEVYLADMPGRLVHEEECVEISQIFEVRGDVDYSVGNLDFIGRITVTGEVLDEFNLKAGMGLEVRGPVGNCRLTSDADIALLGGMSGKTKGRIKAGGVVKARYLNEVKVEAGGDVTVDREAYNSRIRTQGVYRSASGKVVGGEVVALKGIEVGTAGSDLGVATKLWAGVDFRSAERRRSIAERIDRADREIQRISTAIGPLLTDPGRIQHLPTEKKKAVLNLVTHLKHIKEERGALEKERVGAPAAEVRDSVRQINIKERVFHGATVEIGECRLLLKKEASGPLTMLEDVGEGSVRLLPYQELSKSSRLPPEVLLEQQGAPTPEEE